MKIRSIEITVALTGVLLLLQNSRAAGQAPTVNDPVATAIDRAIESQENWDSLRFEAECEVDSEWLSAQVFGSGIGIWERTVQIQLSGEQILEILETAKETRFAYMPPAFDGKDDAVPNPPTVSPDSKAGLKVVCRTKLWIEDVDKEVVQLQRAETSVGLRTLTLKILEIVKDLAPSGTSALSLNDGLRKISQGELAPETLRILYHRRPQERAVDSLGQGFLTRINGRDVSVQSFEPQGGYGPERVFEIAEEELSTLAAELSAQDPDNLPANLWAEHYTDLSISVLNHQFSTQARQFAGMTAESLGTEQERFNRIAEVLYQLSQRAESAGQTMTTAAQPPVK